MAGPRDLYMNFMPMHHDITGGDPSALSEQKVATGLTVRGGLAWIIHKLEVVGVKLSANYLHWDWCLSTVADETTMPDLRDKGVIARGRQEFLLSTNGGGYMAWPQELGYLPPVPIVAPNLSFYIQGEANHNDGIGVYQLRIGFTTEPMTPQMALEISDVWGQS